MMNKDESMREPRSLGFGRSLSIDGFSPSGSEGYIEAKASGRIL